MTNLSKHFTLAELSITQVRTADNTPPPRIIPALKDTAARMERIREVLGGNPVVVSSGYRSPLVNKIVGGAIASAHMTGRAVDFICPAFGPPLAIARAIIAAGVQFDQLIEEGSWVHISFDERMRGQVLSKSPAGGLIAGLPNEGANA